MMNKTWLTAAVIVAASSAFAGDSFYAGTRGLKDQQMTVKSWGSGTIAETDEMVFEGSHSLRISTRNYFQGGRILLGNPTSVADAFGDKNNMLVLTLRTAGSGTTMSGRGGGGAPAGAGDSGPSGRGGPGGFPGGGGRPGGGQVGGARGGAAPGGAGAGGGGAAGAVPPIKNIRLIITTTDGLKSEAYTEVPAGADTRWEKVGFPLQAINGFDKTNKQIKEVAFAADSVGSFYVGHMEVINDSSPVQGEMNYRSDQNIGLSTELEFNALGFSGASPLKYAWDFDGDGQIDAEGQHVKRRFRKEGTFKVTLTISDVYGLKKPYSTSINVKVNP